MNKVFFYGGSFDPFHKGHEGFIKKLIENNPDREIWVVPSYNWLKPTGVFSIQERLDMTALVLKKYPQVKVLDWSLSEDTTSTYFVAKKIKGLGFEPIIALGEDNLNYFAQWKNSASLVKEFNFIILTRNEYNLIKNPPNELAKELINKSTQIEFNSPISSTQIRSGNFTDCLPQEIVPLVLEKIKPQ